MSSHLLSVNPEKLRKAREDSEIRPADVVKKIGSALTRQKLWNWENLPSRVPSDILTRLCQLYNRELATVLDDPDQIFLPGKSRMTRQLSRQ